MGSEIIFVVPYALGFAAMATIGGTLFIWLMWASLRRWGPRSKREALTAFPKGVVGSVLLCLSLPIGCAWACQPTPQPESRRIVAALEVPVATLADHAALLNLVAREAVAEGMTLAPESEVEFFRRNTPDIPITEAYIWRRGVRDSVAMILDMPHDSRVWIAFFRGEDVAATQRFRERATRKIVERWPAALAVPVTTTGGLPHKRDLVVSTKGGYAIDPARMERYGCPETPGTKAGAPATC